MVEEPGQVVRRDDPIAAERGQRPGDERGGGLRVVDDRDPRGQRLRAAEVAQGVERRGAHRRGPLRVQDDRREGRARRAESPITPSPWRGPRGCGRRSPRQQGAERRRRPAARPRGGRRSPGAGRRGRRRRAATARPAEDRGHPGRVPVLRLPRELPRERVGAEPVPRPVGIPAIKARERGDDPGRGSRPTRSSGDAAGSAPSTTGTAQASSVSLRASSRRGGRRAGPRRASPHPRR